MDSMPVQAVLDEPCNNLALRKAARYLGAACDKALAPLGLRATQFTVLQELASQSMAITRLAERIVMDRTTLASSLKPLVREGLVTVESSPDDRRVRMVAMTQEGRSRAAAARPLLQAVESRFDESYGAGDAAQLRVWLGRILESRFAQQSK
ncbi:MarR family winged helix-turn-helix transcriptional regulator [Streptomyces sp. NBC_00687]|uniref:MarR family winged helix-turn-helix transcriptional regulator n=1 Tax=Streptomyces sp. NBC_00687 TaxID=2975807 RepID=UPI00224DD1B0|nr:MarR family transcriptional regulator [Streptomyces sp. NBC_00687]MCX4912044.1 MarR family transcriptional regulator [Streptomyces sp. NBC_00687]